MTRCQHMTACQGAEEPAWWCRLDVDHNGDHDMIEADCTCAASSDSCPIHGPQVANWDYDDRELPDDDRWPC